LQRWQQVADLDSIETGSGHLVRFSGGRQGPSEVPPQVPCVD
jgi:hypothetical protein